MKIELGNIYHFDGCEVHINEDIADEYIPAGFYIFLYREDDQGIALMGRDMKILHITEYENDEEVNVSLLDAEDIIDNLIIGYTSLSLSIIRDGWT